MSRGVSRTMLYNRKLMWLLKTIIFFLALQPSAGYGLLVHEVSCSHKTTRHSQYNSSGQVISPSQRPLPNTQHTQKTNIHARGGIRTHDRSRRAAVDLRFRTRGHWVPAVKDNSRKTVQNKYVLYNLMELYSGLKDIHALISKLVRLRFGLQ
jgi:hypothetical protein